MRVMMLSSPPNFFNHLHSLFASIAFLFNQNLPDIKILFLNKFGNRNLLNHFCGNQIKNHFRETIIHVRFQDKILFIILYIIIRYLVSLNVFQYIFLFTVHSDLLNAFYVGRHIRL